MRPIYLLEYGSSSIGEATTEFIQSDDAHNVGDAPRCPACVGPLGGLHWEPPFRVELESWGIRFGDLAFGPSDSFLVSERFKVLWQRSRLVGLHGFEPVEIVKVIHRGKRIKQAPPRYFRVWVQHSVVRVDPVKSGIQWVSPPTCDVCRVGTMHGRERIVLEGEPEHNVFIARGLPGQVLVDERVHGLCEDNAITNCSLIPVEQASHWY